MKNKLIALMALVVLMFVTASICACAETVASGTYGADVVWTLDDSGTLTLSGTGTMTETNSTNQPWYKYRNDIKKVVVEGEILDISTFAFYNEKNLTEVVLCDSIQSMGSSVFSNCTSLTKITLPKSLNTIGYTAFSGCSSLTEIVFNDSLAKIDTAAFAECTSLTEVKIPESVTVINGNAFRDCTNLKFVTLPKSLTSIGKEIVPEGITVYGYTNTLAQIVAAGCNAQFVSLGECEITIKASGKLTDTVEWALSDIGILTITGEGKMPDYTNENQAPWYDYREEIYDIRFGEGITHIGAYSFKWHTAVLNLTIPKNVESVGAHAFENCNAPVLVIEDGVKTIAEYAFSYMPIDEIVIPDSVTKIYASAFEHCWLMTKATLSANVEDLPDRIFYECRELETVTFKDGNKTIGDLAFASTSLTSVDLPLSVNKIGAKAFYGDKQITRVYFKGDIESVGASAFEGCSVFQYLFASGNIKNVGESAFSGCTKLGSVVLRGAKSIGKKAFYNCSSLGNTFIDNTAGYIDPTAFDKCTYYQFSIRSNPGSLAEHYASKYGYTFSKSGSAKTLVIAEGAMNDTVNWSVSTGGVLTLSGTGKTEEYKNTYSNPCPWSYFDTFITKLVVKNGITHLYNWRIDTNPNIAKVNLDESVIYIASDALPSKYPVTIYASKYSIGEYFAKEYGHSFSQQAIMSEKEIVTGVSGDVAWSLNSRGVLTFTGEGAIDAASAFAWSYYANYVTKIVAAQGISEIKSLKASNHAKLTDLEAHHSVRCITSETYPNALTVTGYKYSIAEYFANNNSHSFVSLGEMPLEVMASGALGDSATWSLDSRGNMTFDGAGTTKGYSYSNIPWKYYADYVKTLTVDEDIYYLSDWGAFAHKNIEKIRLHYKTLVVEDGFSVLSSKVVVEGYDNSTAQYYANKRGLKFMSLGKTEDAVVVSGTKDGFSWSISTLGTLTIEGEGEIPEYTFETSYPWYYYREILTELYLGENITLVPGRAFRANDYNFKKITIPCNVDSISTHILAKDPVIVGYEFSYAEELATDCEFEFISIGIKPEEIVASGTFGDSITWRYTNHRKLTIDGTGTMPTDIAVPWEPYNKKLSTVKITGTVESIAPMAFAGSSLTDIELPLSLVGIGGKAFYNCYKLTQIEIPDSVLAIADNAFQHCTALESISLPPYLVLANFTMIEGCDSLKTICGRDDTFAERLADNYNIEFVSTGEAPERVHMYGTITDAISYEVDNLGDMTVVGEGEIPDLTEYTAYVTDNTDTLRVEGTVTSIGSYAFAGLRNIKNLVLEEGITTIGESAFRYISVEEVRLPSTVTTLGDFAFADCDRMKYIYINDGVTAIPRGMFRYCESLKAIELPDTIKTIDTGIFDYATQDIYIHYAGAEKDWKKVKLVEELPDNVTVIFSSSIPEGSDIRLNSVWETSTSVKVTITATLSGAEAAYIAGYDENGCLVDLVKAIPKTSTYELDKSVKKVKVFLWNSITDFTPMSEAYSKEL